MSDPFYTARDATLASIAQMSALYAAAVAPPSSPPPPVVVPPLPPTNGLKAVITQLQTSVIAGQGVNVNALASTITTGTWLTTMFKWDFGDPTSLHNVTPGFNSGHVYDTPGTYTITLTLTDSSGGVSMATATVTVKADTRPIVYVDSVAGSDSNLGTSPALAMKTTAKAFSHTGSNSKIEYKRGQTFNVPATVNIAVHDLYIGAYGTGAAPVLRWSGPDVNASLLYLTNTASNITIAGLAFDSPQVIPAPSDPAGVTAISTAGTNVVVRDCTFLNINFAVDGSRGPNGIIVQDNSVPLLKGMRGYFCWVDGPSWTILGNTVVNTTRAHCVRVNSTAAVGVLIYGNNLTKQYPPDDPAEQYKTTVDLRIGSYIYVANNTLSESTAGISPSPGQTADQVVAWAVFDSNIVNNAQLVIDSVGQHVMYRNNVLNIAGTGQIVITASGATVPGAVLGDIHVINNTGTNPTANGEMIDVMGNPAPKSITISGNLFVAPSLRYGNNWTSGMHIGCPDMSGFTSITGNIWPAPNTVGTPNVVNIAPQGLVTPAQWNTLTGVSNDQFVNQPLPSGSYQLTVNGVTAGSTVGK